MPWLLPASISVFIATGTLAVAYLYLWRSHKEKYLLLFATSWSLYSLRFTFLIAEAIVGPKPALSLAYQSTALLSAIPLVLGARLFSRSSPSRTWTGLLLVGIAWTFAGPSMGLDAPYVAAPVFLLLAGSDFQVAWSFWKTSPDFKSRALQTTAILFLFWGLHKLNYPFLRYLPGAAPIGYLLGGFFALATALGTILAYYEHVRAQLLRSESRFRTVVDNIGDALYMADMKGDLIEVNESSCKALGYSRQELLRMRILDVSAEYNEPDRKTIFEDLIAQHSLLIQDTHKRKDGSTFPVEIRVSLVPIQEELFVIGSARDVSEREQMQAEREVMLKSLGQAQKLEALGTLTGGIAHDFNNILTSIKCYAELASSNLAPHSPEADDLAMVMSSTSRAEDLVKGLLAFSRNTGEERVPVLVSPTVKEVLKMLRPAIPTTIDIQTSLSDVGTILAAPSHLQQILMNLCTNAYQAMPDRGTLSVSLSRSAGEVPDLPSGDYALLCVSDTGAGIPPEILDRIFDPFFTTKAPGKGTGLGLAMVHGIATSLGGRVTVTSTLGEGSQFNVFLPLLPPTVSTSRQSVAPQVAGKETILFVDDEDSISRVAKKMLQRLGYSVHCCTDSQKALDLIESTSFDLLITDQTMPRLTGIELIEKARMVRPNLKTILCTGYSDQLGESQAKAAGANAFLMKPYGSSVLSNTIRQVLDPP